uniref:Uncharacterized protein LOC100373140 n=1 Tax=Saccoglossus kowalevskii TaxID=10224 RepID=A0ABM0GY96_SACKO|nr:PREDICTED: uncharacterized protein LOC100373140 [Saccoglossus kowalevskii]
MAAAPLSEKWVYNNDTLNGARLSALLINEGTLCMRRVFDNNCPPGTLQQVLNTTRNSKMFNELLRKKILNQRQYDLLYPPAGQNPSLEKIDITLLVVLIRNLCKLKPPNWSGWNKDPQPNDNSVIADVIRLKQFRNELYGHIVSTKISDMQFTQHWSDISNILIRLGCKTPDIEKYKTQSLDPTTWLELLMEIIQLCRDDSHYRKVIMAKYEDMERRLTDKITNERNWLDTNDCAEELRKHYKDRMNYVEPVPWYEDGFQLNLEDVYTQLEFSERTKRGDEITDVDFQQCLCQDNLNHRILVEGEAGSGKSTLLRKLALEWANETEPMVRYDLVLLLELRQITKYSTIIDLIFDQLLPEDSNIDKHTLNNFLRTNQHKVLILLDGADELNETFKTEVFKLIEGKIFSKCRVIITSRTIGRLQLIRRVNKHYIMKGLTDDNINSYIQKFFNKEKKELADKLKKDVTDWNMTSYVSTPLILVLICVLYEDLEGKFPSTLSELYHELTFCVYKRYCLKHSIPISPTISDDDSPEFKSLKSRLGELAYNGLKEGKLRFDQGSLDQYKITESDLAVGYFNLEYSTARIKYQQIYAFKYKSLQEFMAAYYLYACMKKVSEECIHYIITEKGFYMVCEFLAGLLGRDEVPLLFRKIIDNIKSVQNTYTELFERLTCLAFICLYHIQESQIVGEVVRTIIRNNEMRFNMELVEKYVAIYGLTSVIRYCNKESIKLKKLELDHTFSNFPELFESILPEYKYLHSTDLLIAGSSIQNCFSFLKHKSVGHAALASTISSKHDELAVYDLLDESGVTTSSLSLLLNAMGKYNLSFVSELSKIKLNKSLHSLSLLSSDDVAGKLLTYITVQIINHARLTSLTFVAAFEYVSSKDGDSIANILKHNTNINKLHTTPEIPNGHHK